jgi:hypothetical protein
MMLFNFYPNHTFLFPLLAVAKLKSKSQRRELDAHIEDLYSILHWLGFEMKLNEISATVEKRDLIIMTPKAHRKKRKNFEFLSIF